MQLVCSCLTRCLHVHMSCVDVHIWKGIFVATPLIRFKSKFHMKGLIYPPPTASSSNTISITIHLKSRSAWLVGRRP